MLLLPNTKTEQPETVNLPGDAKQPMLHTACDLFSATGKQWLALVDRFSGYAWTVALRKLDTKAIIQHLEQWFNDFGWPPRTGTKLINPDVYRCTWKTSCADWRGCREETQKKKRSPGG